MAISVHLIIFVAAYISFIYCAASEYSKVAYPYLQFQPYRQVSGLLHKRSHSGKVQNASLSTNHSHWYSDALSNVVHHKGESIRDILFRVLSRSEFEQVRNLPRRIQPYWDILSSMPKKHSLEMDQYGNVQNISMQLSPVTVDLPPRLTLLNPRGKVNRMAMAVGVKTTFLVESDVEMFDRNTTIRIYQKTGDWYAEAELFEIKLGSIIRNLPFSKRLDQLLSHPWFRVIDNLGLSHSSVLVPIREQAYFVKIRGSPTVPLLDMLVPHMEMLLGWVNALPIVAAIFHIDINRLAETLQRLPGLSQHNWSGALWFLSRLPIVSITYIISLSNINFSEYGDVGPDYFWATKSYFKKTLPAWYSNPLSRGRTLAMAIRAPKSCDAQSLWCTYLRYILRDNTFLFSAAIDSLEFFELRADLRSIDFGLFKLAPAAVLIASNPEWPHIAVFGQFNKTMHDGTVLTFKVEIGLAASSLVKLDPFLRSNRCGTSVQMEGLWKTPFGIPWLTIANAHIRKVGTYSLPWTLASDIFRSAFGGEFYLGRNCFNGTVFLPESGCVAGSGDIMVDKKNFLAEGFQFRFNRLSLGDLVRNIFPPGSPVLEFFNRTFSSVWQNTGFPDGLALSFAWIPVKDPYRFVPQGLVLNATRINFGNLSASAKGRISLWDPTVFYLDIQLPRIEGAGIAIRKNKTLSDEGPILFANISPSSTLANGSAYVSLLDWFESYAAVSVVNRRLELQFAQGIPRWLGYKSKVWADWGRHIPSSFFWRLELNINWISWFRQAVQTVLKRFSLHVARKIQRLKAAREMLFFLNSTSINSTVFENRWWKGNHHCTNMVVNKCIKDACSPSSVDMSNPFANITIAQRACENGTRSVKWMCVKYCYLSKLSQRAALAKLEWSMRRKARLHEKLLVYKQPQWIESKLFFDISTAAIEGSIEDYMKRGYFEVLVEGHIYNATAARLVPWSTKIRTDHRRLLSAAAETLVAAGRKGYSSVKNVFKQKDVDAVTPLITKAQDIYGSSGEQSPTTNPVAAIAVDALKTLRQSFTGYNINTSQPELFEVSHIVTTPDWSISVHRQFLDSSNVTTAVENL